MCRGHTHQNLNPKSCIPNPESRIPNPESRIPNPESRVLKSESRHLKCEYGKQVVNGMTERGVTGAAIRLEVTPETPNLEPRTRYPKPDTRDLKPETWNPIPDSRDL